MKSINKFCLSPCTRVAPLIMLLLTCGNIYGHSVKTNSEELTPPTVARLEEISALRKDFGDGAPVIKGVFSQMTIWPAWSELRACFYDGETSLKRFFVDVARKWLNQTSLKVDFGDPKGGYRKCDSPPFDKNDIRITFNMDGYWSYIGRESLYANVIQKGPSLNINTGGASFNRLNQKVLEPLILHEFGHAIGLMHEHQSPESRCADELDWPHLYEYAKKNWGWDEEKARMNFVQYFSSPRLRTTPYDRQSIMHYAVPASMFKKGSKSPCFVPRPTKISQWHRVTVISAYPTNISLQERELQKRAALAGMAMGRLNLNATQLRQRAWGLPSP